MPITILKFKEDAFPCNGDTLNPQPQTPVVSVSEVIPSLMSESKFADKVSGKNTRNVMGVIDELMDTLSVVNPRLYEGVMAKL